MTSSLAMRPPGRIPYGPDCLDLQTVESLSMEPPVDLGAGLGQPDDIPPDNSSPVEILWRDGIAENVIVRDDWADHLTPPELLATIRDLVNAERGGSTGGDWRFKLSLANISLHNLAEFNAQLADARAEEAANRREPQIHTTMHFRAVWHDGALVELTGDDSWSQTPLEVMGRDLAEAIVAPEVPAGTTKARDRLLAFMGQGV